jgi:DNA-binding transcriptional ArsR family regulator
VVIDQSMLTDEALEMVAARFRCLAEPMRLKILRALQDGERTVGQLVRQLEANQANISKHLKMLMEAGVVSRRSQGTSAHYSISDPMIIKLCHTVCNGLAEQLKTQAEGFGLTLTKRRAAR